MAPSIVLKSQYREESAYITFNLRGYMVNITWPTIQRFPQISPFSKSLCEDEKQTLLDILEYYFSHNKQLFIDRNPFIFNYILDYLTQGDLHIPACLCLDSFQKELQFWGFENKHLAACCYDRVLKETEAKETNARLTKLWVKMTKPKEFKVNKPDDHCPSSSGKVKCTRISQLFHKYREKVWNILENHFSSKAAMVSNRRFYFPVFQC